MGIFALFHVEAHGAEMSATAGGLSYGAGFVVATVVLHFVEIALGVFTTRRSGKIATYAGWGIAAAGAVLVAR